jgi:transcriptional regulator with XRE-family HTH domain
MTRAGILSVSSIDVLIGRRLRDARIRAGLSTPQAGRLLAVTGAELDGIERGEIRARADFLYEATRTYGLALADLFHPPQADNDH